MTGADGSLGMRAGDRFRMSAGCSGTGLFVVYNDRRDTLAVTPETMLGRSFVVKFTRLFDF
jgi:hypothetical protein